jgi:lipopolysaccharide biosynthesis protein
LSLARKIHSFALWLVDSEKSPRDFIISSSAGKFTEIESTISSQQVNGVTLTAHVFYEDFADELLDALKKFPKDTRVLATTPHEHIRVYLEKSLSSIGLRYEVRLTPNIGRNFGPLLVEFSGELLKTKSFIHVHSKKSKHSPEIAREWLRRSTDLFLSHAGLLSCFDTLENHDDIGLIYANSSDLVRGINFRWGRSRYQMKKLFGSFPGFENIKWSGRLLFPAGGMFWVKTDAIRPLLEFPWTYEVFPGESGQIDGATQHGIERVIGELTRARGYKQAAHVRTGTAFLFTSD